uniref:Uncharacterized protein n=1 Tax=Cacopsylla melanoneura TaxID=428564 RepID=A0A8D8PPD0_9HEMI
MHTSLDTLLARFTVFQAKLNCFSRKRDVAHSLRPVSRKRDGSHSLKPVSRKRDVSHRELTHPNLNHPMQDITCERSPFRLKTCHHFAGTLHFSIKFTQIFLNSLFLNIC